MVLIAICTWPEVAFATSEWLEMRRGPAHLQFCTAMRTGLAIRDHHDAEKARELAWYAVTTFFNMVDQGCQVGIMANISLAVCEYGLE